MGSLKEQISESLAFMPIHRKKFKRSATLNLDLLLDDARSTGGVDAGTLDLILMGYRYSFPFRESLKDFSKGKLLSPPELEDFFQVVFAALMSRTQIPAPVMVFEAVEFAAQHFGPFVKGVSNAFFREVMRRKEGLETVLAEKTELLLGDTLFARFNGHEADARKLGKLVLERPEAGIHAFSRAQPVLRKVTATDFQGKTDPLQAMDPGSWDYCAWSVAKIHEGVLADTPEGQVAYIDLLDACAAPGGKLIAAYTLMESTGNSGPRRARINRMVATDAKHPRLERLRSNLKRFGLQEPLVECRLHVWGEDPAPINDTYDVIFADLPCSGLGTLHTRPDLLLEDIAVKVETLKPLQASILRALVPQLKAGGHLLVSLCSVDPEESRHIEQTLASLGQAQPALTILDRYDSFAKGDGVRVEGIRAWLLRA